MEINKPLKSEQLILLNARKAVVIAFIIFVIYILFSTFLLGFDIVNNTGGNELTFFKRLFTLPVAAYENNANYYSMIFTLLIIIYAILFGRLYNIMSKNIILSLIIGILMIVLSWFALGIGMLLLTIYLLVKSNTALKELEK